MGFVFLAALGVRFAAGMVGFFLVPDGWLALDDDTYRQLAAEIALGETGTWDPYLHALYRSAATFLVPLTWLYRALGPSELVGVSLVALVGSGVAALTTKLALQSLDTRWAVGAGIVVALLPSQIAWSVVLLKDAWVWAVTAALALAIAVASRARGRVLWLSVLAVPAMLFLLGHLRLQSTFVAAWAVVGTALLIPRPRKSLWVGGALIVALVVPWLAGGGPGGIDPVLARGRNFEETRAAAATGADSAFVAALSAGSTTTVSQVEREEAGSTTIAAVSPQPPSSVPPSTVSQVEGEEAGAMSRIRSDLAHLPRGLSVMLLEPYPWDANRNSRVVLAKIEMIFWYPILGLAFVGVFHVRRHGRVLWFPLLYGVGVLIGYALSEGNLGTAFRHRGEFVWVAALLAAFGAQDLWNRRQARRSLAGQ